MRCPRIDKNSTSIGAHFKLKWIFNRHTICRLLGIHYKALAFGFADMFRIWSIQRNDIVIKSAQTFSNPILRMHGIPKSGCNKSVRFWLFDCQYHHGCMDTCEYMYFWPIFKYAERFNIHRIFGRGGAICSNVVCTLKIHLITQNRGRMPSKCFETAHFSGQFIILCLFVSDVCH